MNVTRAAIALSLCATSLLTACGGGGGGAAPPVSAAPNPTGTPAATPPVGATATPSPTPTAAPTLTPAPTSSPTATPAPTPTPSATPTPAPPVFTGGSQTVAFTSSGGTFTVTPADNSYSGSAVFGSNNASGTFNFTLSWATYAQISGTFAPGPLPSSIGTALLYFDFNSSVAVSFPNTPAVTVSTSGSFPGTKCGYAIYAQIGFEAYPQWNSMTSFGISETTPSAGSYTVPSSPLPYGNTANFAANTDEYMATYCH